ncbi:MAG: DUF5067 domain-containing protein [Clostridia bacterium]|nr:DUF5067 domain-containing protein [Clostridia bacterium]
MKKFIALLLSLLLVLSLTACGDKEEKAEDPAPAAEKTETQLMPEKNPEIKPQTEQEPKPETEPESKAEAFTLPEISGVTHEMSYSLEGMDITADYEDLPLIRFWFKITNDSDSLQSPTYLSAWDGLVVTQCEEELNGSSLKEGTPEESVAIRDLYPGTTVLFSEGYTLVNDTDIITVTLTDDDQEYTFEVDPTALTPILPEPFEWVPVTDTDWFEPIADEYANYNDVTERLTGYEVIDGMPWVGSESVKVIRIYSEVTNASDKEQRVSSFFTPMQDGVELALGRPAEGVDSDILINTTLQPNETKTLSQSYVLYSSDPVFNVRLDWGDTYGAVYTVE